MLLRILRRAGYGPYGYISCSSETTEKIFGRDIGYESICEYFYQFEGNLIEELSDSWYFTICDALTWASLLKSKTL